jgi:serine/threonine protein kinase
MSKSPKTSPMVTPGNPDATATPRAQEEVATGAPSADAVTLIGQPNAPGKLESLVGKTFGDFELREEVGRGGMGVVYKAWQKCLERPVALKLLLAEHACNPDLYGRFMAEARAAASLAHPNIVSVYQVGQCVAGPYFVMELIDGPSLETLSQRTLPISWSVSLLITVAEAVQHAHERGIIHRDLKPGNIMLHLSRRPVVMDFGIAKMMGKGTGVNTHPGTLIGTPAYMPPEQADDTPSKVPIGPTSDVYSLGAILYTLLTGKVPYDEGSALRTLMRVLAPTPPPPVRSLRPEVPVRLEQICMKCLEKDQANRYPTAQSLADELKRLRAALGVKPTSSATLRTPLPTVVLVRSRHKPIRLVNPTTTVGRSSECDLVLRTADVSKLHCRILLGPDGVVVEDLGSSNGTFVNGTQIERAPLQDGDELEVGGHVLRVRIRAAR